MTAGERARDFADRMVALGWMPSSSDFRLALGELLVMVADEAHRRSTSNAPALKHARAVKAQRLAQARP